MTWETDKYLCSLLLTTAILFLEGWSPFYTSKSNVIHMICTSSFGKTNNCTCVKQIKIRFHIGQYVHITVQLLMLCMHKYIEVDLRFEYIEAVSSRIIILSELDGILPTFFQKLQRNNNQPNILSSSRALLLFHSTALELQIVCLSGWYCFRS